MTNTETLNPLYVVGIYLADKPRDILYRLARSKNLWERCTAIVGTGQFIRQVDVAQRPRGLNS
jgi:hypothetical protein